MNKSLVPIQPAPETIEGEFIPKEDAWIHDYMDMHRKSYQAAWDEVRKARHRVKEPEEIFDSPGFIVACLSFLAFMAVVGGTMLYDLMHGYY